MPDLGEFEGSRLTELTAEFEGTLNVGALNDNTNPIILKKWQLNQPSIIPKQRIRFVQGTLNSIMKRDSGGGTVQFGFITSTNGVAFDDAFFRLLESDSSETANDSDGGAFFTDTDRLFFAIMAFNSNGSTSGTCRNSICTVTIQLPPQYTLTRLV